jgi:hypothetical protein
MSGWAANWETSEGKGKLLKHALNDLRGALAERCAAANRTVPALCPEIGTGDIILSSWFTAFQAEITALIPLFVNHTDSGGDWSGQSTIPAWNEADILTAIGDPARLPAPTDPLISAAWMFQQYNMLNLLKWRRYTNVLTKDKQIREASEAGYATLAAAIIACNNAYTAASWSTTTQGLRAGTSTVSTPGSHWALKDNIRGTLYYQGQTTDLYKSVDLYTSGVRIGTPSAKRLYGNESPNFNATESLYAKSATSAENNLATDDFAFEQDNPLDFFTSRPEDSDFYDINAQLASSIMVFKFDGVNGFQYKNW